MTIGKRIKALRNEYHLTQEQLALQLGVSRQAISKWEQDLNEPDIETLIKLSQIFDMTIDELVKGEKQETMIENNLEDMNQEILITHKRNHKLLMFIVGFLMTCFVLFVVLPAIAHISDGANPKVEREGIKNISQQLTKYQSHLGDFNLWVKDVDCQNQTMLLSGFLSTTFDKEDKKMIIIYQDNQQVVLDLIVQPDNSIQYTFEKEIPAKNIQTIILELGDEPITLKDVSFPIEEYLYEKEYQIYLSAKDKENFIVNIHSTDRKVKNDSFEDIVLSMNDYDTHGPYHLDIIENDEVIYSEKIDLYTNSEIIVPYPYHNDSQYTVIITYETAMKKQYQWKKTISNDSF